MLESKLERIGKMIAERMRVQRLRWVVFSGWCAHFRSGNKIKRIALARVGGQGRNDLLA